MFSDSIPSWPMATFHSPRLIPRSPDEAGVEDRQNRVPGFCSKAVARAHILLVGAGGLIGAIAGGLARKGYGTLSICDHDRVELSNLNRQDFYPEDVTANEWKAIALARNAARQGQLGTVLAKGIDLMVVGVDSNRCRAVASRFCRQRRLPVIFTAVSQAADWGWVFVQEPSDACVACLFPFLADAVNQPEPCTISPGVLDILRVMGGMALYAVDTLVMNRRRDWNYRSVQLPGDAPDVIDLVRPRPGCPVCLGSG
jgi:molybdopterin/thiamine biosynthesis adenylyltransferase